MDMEYIQAKYNGTENTRDQMRSLNFLIEEVAGGSNIDQKSLSFFQKTLPPAV